MPRQAAVARMMNDTYADLSAAIDSGHTVAQAMPITSLAREFYQLIDDKLGGLNGSNEVMRYYLDD